MFELVYADSTIEKVINAKYPNAKITDASDFIHDERFECEIDGIEEDEFYIFAILNGFADGCLGFNIMKLRNKEDSNKKLWDWFAEADAIKESEKVAVDGK